MSDSEAGPEMGRRPNLKQQARGDLSLQVTSKWVSNSLGASAIPCYSAVAFVALVTPLDSIKGAASNTCCPFFVVRLEAVEKHQIAQTSEKEIP
jgi:hypothetical protein